MKVKCDDLDRAAGVLASKAGMPVENARRFLESAPGDERARIIASLGFLPNGRKVGRPTSKTLDVLRKAMPEASPRTHARYAHALRMLYEAGVTDPEAIERHVALFTRPNGSFNVSGFEQHAEYVYAMSLDGGDDDG